MSQSGYTAWNVTAGEVPTTAYWNILGTNDASFNTGNGFNDGILQSRHFGNAVIPGSAMAIGSISQGISTVAGEISYTASTWTNVAGFSQSLTTTVANQQVVCFAQAQTYNGGYSSFRFAVDGVGQANNGKYQTGVNSATTGAYVYFDYFTIASAGAHTITFQAYAGSSGLRIINSEGTGKMIALLA